MELSRDSQEGLVAKEILPSIALLRKESLSYPQRAMQDGSQTHPDFKHFPCTLAVTRRQDGGVAVDKATLMEKVVNCHGSSMPGTENAGKLVGVCPEVGESPNVVPLMPHSSLERVVLKQNIFYNRLGCIC